MSMPSPRYRLYTYWQSYLPLLLKTFFGDKSDAAPALESSLRDFLRVENVQLAPMCRSALYLLIKNAVEPGKEIILSPYTIADVINMVILAGARPVFADIDASTCNIDADKAAALINERTAAILATHLHGLPAEIDKLKSLAESHDILLMEDAAQAFGASYGGKMLGTIGDAGVFSFGTYKNVNAWYGGAVTCRDDELAGRLRDDVAAMPPQSRGMVIGRMLQGLTTDIATWPPLFRLFTFWVFRFGHLHEIGAINRFVQTELDLSRRQDMPTSLLSRMTPGQCDLLRQQLDHVAADNETRRNHAARYREQLTDVPYIDLPVDLSGDGAIYTYYPIQVTNRTEVLRWLALKGCDIGPQHLKNCADLPAFEEFHRDCPIARRVAEALVLLPTYPSYPDSSIQRTIDVLKEYPGPRTD